MGQASAALTPAGPSLIVDDEIAEKGRLEAEVRATDRARREADTQHAAAETLQAENKIQYCHVCHFLSGVE